MLIELTDPEACVDAVVARVGHNLRIATPLALGKPNHLLNAFYRRAKVDSSIRLTIITALTLERPKGHSELEKRFLQPFVERSFGNYPDLEYELDRVAQKLPDNIRVLEFYFAPAKYFGNSQAQRDYICSNYTHIARDTLARDVNVLLQQVAPGVVDDVPKLSLSSNPDLTLDIMAGMRRREAQGLPIAIVAQTNSELPFMFGDAVVDADSFDYVLDNPELDYTLFGLPKRSLSDTDFMTGIYCSMLVRDGGELQIGIGALGDALVHGLLLRQEHNTTYNALVNSLDIEDKFPTALEQIGETNTFEQGLFAGSEMLVDGFIELYKRGVVKRNVYDDPALQRALNQGLISEQVTAATLDTLIEQGAVTENLHRADVDYLVHYGVFQQGVKWVDGNLHTPGGKVISTNLAVPENREQVYESCLGKRLQHGAVMHGAFFLGNQAFYQALRELSPEDRQKIQMRRVRRTNQLYGHEEIDRLHRRYARFFNTCMMVTLSGAAVSDGLESGEVLSGIGGQYNFVEMAHALPDGHSVLNFRATRINKGKVISNIVWNYGHISVPRHLRDVYVNEYGIAFVRGKTDEEIIKQLLNITDSRFQQKLLKKAKVSGKLDPEYQIPEAFTDNYPETVSRLLAPHKTGDLFPPFPFDCEFTDEELKLAKALKKLKARSQSPLGILQMLAGACVKCKATQDMLPLLQRMQLDSPKGIKERLFRKLLCAELSRA